MIWWCTSLLTCQLLSLMIHNMALSTGRGWTIWHLSFFFIICKSIFRHNSDLSNLSNSLISEFALDTEAIPLPWKIYICYWAVALVSPTLWIEPWAWVEQWSLPVPGLYGGCSIHTDGPTYPSPPATSLLNQLKDNKQRLNLRIGWVEPKINTNIIWFLKNTRLIDTCV